MTLNFTRPRTDQLDTMEPTALTESPRLLIADDDVLVTRAFARVLRGGGFEVEVVHDGAAALERLHFDPPIAAVILDIRMPGIDGRDVLASLQRFPTAAPIPVLVVSGSSDEYALRLAGKLGARDVMQKPVYGDQLVNRVRWLLESWPEERPASYLLH